jgi:hypothetical protein
MIEAMRGVPATEFTQPAPIEPLADKAKRDARGGFDLGGRSDAPGIPGGLNYYPNPPVPSAVPPTTATTVPPEPEPEPTTTTTVAPTTTTTRSSSTTTTFGFRRSSSTTTTTTASSRDPLRNRN